MFEQRAYKRVLNGIEANLQKMEVKPGKCRYNFRCHNNAVHEALKKGQDKIAMCFYIEGGQPVIHFVNIDKNGNYVDNTLGVWTTQFEYYLIRHIEKQSYFDVLDIFTAFREELKRNLPWYIRLLAKIEF